MKTGEKTVVVCGNKDILSASIQNFLARNDDWKVFSTDNLHAFESNDVVKHTFSPDVVIIIPNETYSCSTDAPLWLLDYHDDIKVIVVSLENNLMEIYTKQKILINKAADLLSIIQQES